MLPAPRYTRLSEHKYNLNGFEVLKMASIYGANAAGKSNVIKALSLLQMIIVEEELPIRIKESQFKFMASAESTPQVLSVEFFQAGKAFLYAIEITNGIISTEELYLSGLGKVEDSLLFERKTTAKGECVLRLMDGFEQDAESMVLKRVIEKNLAKPDKPILKLLSSLDNAFLDDIKIAIQWFTETLVIITPDAKPNALVRVLDMDADFKKYAEDVMRSLDVGITNLRIEKKGLRNFFGEGDEQKLDFLIAEIEKSPQKMVFSRIARGEEVMILKEEGDYFVKQLKLTHLGSDDASILFDLDEESDGTIRLLDFIPAFRDLVTQPKVYVIDEMERSIHPLLIKELVKKFSLDDNTLGQLVFTTHEANLLDQDIFRQDEIWFVEKNKQGSTELYSLSDFKEHNTIDIRKGYLNGRYGSIPFLANLHHLNWHSHDYKK